MSHPTSRASIITMVSIITVVGLVLAVFVFVTFRAKERDEAARKPSVLYVVDDVKSTIENSRTRWFVECEDVAAPDDDARERHVWVSDAQRRKLRKGDPCPLGEAVKPQR